MGTLAALYAAKLGEQVERAVHLLGLAPPGREAWRPELPGAGAALPLAEVREHLRQSLAGIAATLYGLHPARFSNLLPLRGLGPGADLALYWRELEPALGQLSDGDLATPVATVFRPLGEPALTLLLGNLEHFINHKYQLFFYLKLLGAPVATRDLYQLR